MCIFSNDLIRLFHYLDQYPKVYLKLAYEIRSKKIDLKGLNVNEMKKEYPYLNKVIMESLRLSPPFATSFPRLVPESGLMIDGIYLPPKVKQ
jgi:cytochrome P450